MTFTMATIKKLRALGLDEVTTDKVLEIFEEARLAKAKIKGSAVDRQARGSRLPEDWTLPPEWREWALAVGLMPREVDREATKFKNYWLNAAGIKGVKLKWFLTFQNWCMSMLERAGRQPLTYGAGESAPKPQGPEAFTDATWRAVAKRYKSSGQWSSDWGPEPGRMDCEMPAKYL